jgi:hypothetical protein
MTYAFQYKIRATANAQTLSRIINSFAQRDLLPTSVLCETRAGGLDISILMPDLDPATAQIIAEKMRSMVLVEDVQMTSAVLRKRHNEHQKPS